MRGAAQCRTEHRHRVRAGSTRASSHSRRSGVLHRAAVEGAAARRERPRVGPAVRIPVVSLAETLYGLAGRPSKRIGFAADVGNAAGARRSARGTRGRVRSPSRIPGRSAASELRRPVRGRRRFIAEHSIHRSGDRVDRAQHHPHVRAVERLADHGLSLPPRARRHRSAGRYSSAPWGPLSGS